MKNHSQIPKHGPFGVGVMAFFSLLCSLSGAKSSTDALKAFQDAVKSVTDSLR